MQNHRTKRISGNICHATTNGNTAYSDRSVITVFQAFVGRFSILLLAMPPPGQTGKRRAYCFTSDWRLLLNLWTRTTRYFEANEPTKTGTSGQLWSQSGGHSSSYTRFEVIDRPGRGIIFDLFGSSSFSSLKKLLFFYILFGPCVRQFWVGLHSSKLFHAYSAMYQFRLHKTRYIRTVSNRKVPSSTQSHSRTSIRSATWFISFWACATCTTGVREGVHAEERSKPRAMKARRGVKLLQRFPNESIFRPSMSRCADSLDAERRNSDNSLHCAIKTTLIWRQRHPLWERSANKT